LRRNFQVFFTNIINEEEKALAHVTARITAPLTWPGQLLPGVLPAREESSARCGGSGLLPTLTRADDRQPTHTKNPKGNAMHPPSADWPVHR